MWCIKCIKKALFVFNWFQPWGELAFTSLLLRNCILLLTSKHNFSNCIAFASCARFEREETFTIIKLTRYFVDQQYFHVINFVAVHSLLIFHDYCDVYNCVGMRMWNYVVVTKLAKLRCWVLNINHDSDNEWKAFFRPHVAMTRPRLARSHRHHYNKKENNILDTLNDEPLHEFIMMANTGSFQGAWTQSFVRHHNYFFQRMNIKKRSCNRKNLATHLVCSRYLHLTIVT